MFEPYLIFLEEIKSNMIIISCTRLRIKYSNNIKHHKYITNIPYRVQVKIHVFFFSLVSLYYDKGEGGHGKMRSIKGTFLGSSLGLRGGVMKF